MDKNPAYVASLEFLDAQTVDAVVDRLKDLATAEIQLNNYGAQLLISAMRRERYHPPTIDFMLVMLARNAKTSGEWNLVGMIQQFMKLSANIRRFWS